MHRAAGAPKQERFGRYNLETSGFLRTRDILHVLLGLVVVNGEPKLLEFHHPVNGNNHLTIDMA